MKNIKFILLLTTIACLLSQCKVGNKQSLVEDMLPLIGKEGNYHTREIWLYRDFLRENMAFRAAKYMKKMGKNM